MKIEEPLANNRINLTRISRVRFGLVVARAGYANRSKEENEIRQVPRARE